MLYRLRSSIPNKTALAAAVGAAFFSHAAFAQTVQTAPGADPRRAGTAKVTQETGPEAAKPGDSDSERMDNAFQPKGFELGSFLLLPKIETDAIYSSNLFATEHDAKSEYVAIVRPEFRLRSRFATHAVNVFGNLEVKRHRRYKSDDTVDGRLVADGRYDLSSTDELTAQTDFTYRNEDRGSPDAVGGAEPTPTAAYTAKLAGKHKFGRFTFKPEVEVARRTFEDVDTSGGGRINNSDRNRVEIEGQVTGSYEMFPGYAWVVAASANSRRYDDRLDDQGYDRSSRGWRVDTGVGLDLTDLVRGDLLVGYLSQNYNDARLSDPSGFSVRATLNWTPTKLTLVVPALERSVQETTLANASAIVRTSASVLVRHEYARNVLLTGNLSYSYDKFEGSTRADSTYEARARATYAFTPEVHLGGEARYKVRDSNAQNSSYDQTVIGLRLSLQM